MIQYEILEQERHELKRTEGIEIQFEEAASSLVLGLLTMCSRVVLSVRVRYGIVLVIMRRYSISRSEGSGRRSAITEQKRKSVKAEIAKSKVGKRPKALGRHLLRGWDALLVLPADSEYGLCVESAHKMLAS